MSDEETRRRKPKPSTLAGPLLKGKWFRAEGKVPVFDHVDLTRFTTVEEAAVSPWYQKVWAWLRKKARG